MSTCLHNEPCVGKKLCCSRPRTCTQFSNLSASYSSGTANTHTHGLLWNVSTRMDEVTRAFQHSKKTASNYGTTRSCENIFGFQHAQNPKSCTAAGKSCWGAQQATYLLTYLLTHTCVCVCAKPIVDVAGCVKQGLQQRSDFDENRRRRTEHFSPHSATRHKTLKQTFKILNHDTSSMPQSPLATNPYTRSPRSTPLPRQSSSSEIPMPT